MGWTIWGFNPCRFRKFLSSPKYPRPTLEPPWALLCVAEWPGHEADHLPPSSDEVKNNLSYFSTLPICLMACVQEKLTFLPLLQNGNANTNTIILPSVLCAGNNMSLYTGREHIVSASE
jgi:hypothetical protein